MSIKIGVVSRSFPGFSNAQTAAYMAEHGFSSTELCLTASDSNYWVYNGASDISGVTDKRYADICEIYRSQGIEIAAAGVFTNLIDQDDKALETNIEYFKAHMRWASQNDIPFVSTECGFDPAHRGVRADKYEWAISRLKESLPVLLRECEKFDVSIALECCVIDIIPSAKRARDIIEQLGSGRLKALLDPANLIANSSEDDMFNYLAPHIAYFHGKDRRVNDAYGRAVGDGDIDWPKFLKLYHKHSEGAPFILEYVTPENMAMIRNRVLAYNT